MPLTVNVAFSNCLLSENSVFIPEVHLSLPKILLNCASVITLVKGKDESALVMSLIRSENL